MDGRGDVIQMEPAMIADIVDQAEDVLIKATLGPQIYQRSQELVRVTRLDEVKDENGVRRRAGIMVITPVDGVWLKERLDTVADWRAYKNVTGQGWKWVPSSPRGEYVDTLLGRKAWRFPVLRGISTTPTLAADGRIVQEPGFDEGTGVYLDFKEGAYPPVPEVPTLEDAKAALKVFAHPLREMPWTSPAARSVALSAGLTALVRTSLRAAPLHAFDAPSKGSGKSLCCDWVGCVKLGQAPPAMNQGANEEEDEKRLGSALRAGDQIVLIDNVKRPVEGDCLCTVLTQETAAVRILGENRRVILPTGATFLASGNNLTTRGDMTRRVIICRLDPKCEHPEERVYDFDVRIETLAQRAQIVVAGLTVLRAYWVAGRPGRDKLTGFGSFEDWSGMVRAALIWAGEADPLDTRAQIVEGDSEQGELAEVMDLWWTAFQDREHKVGDIKTQVEAAELQEKLIEVTGGRDWDAQKVGWWLRRMKDRVVAGRAFRPAGVSQGAARWKLEQQMDLPMDPPMGKAA